jgi:hypothetical protein
MEDKLKNSPPFSSLPRSFMKKTNTVADASSTQDAPRVKKTAFDLPKGKDKLKCLTVCRGQKR